jgi:hypothetical protein
MFGVKARDFEEISKATGNFTYFFYFADYYLILQKYFVCNKAMISLISYTKY